MFGGPVGGLLGMFDVLGKFRQEKKLRRKAWMTTDDGGRLRCVIENGVAKVTPAMDQHLGTLALAFTLKGATKDMCFAVTRSLWGEPEETTVNINGEPQADLDLDVHVGTRGPLKAVVTFTIEWTDALGENAVEVAAVLKLQDLL